MNDKDQRKNVLCDLVIKYPDVLSDIRLFKALILDYIPNDKLNYWLFGRRYTTGDKFNQGYIFTTDVQI